MKDRKLLASGPFHFSRASRVTETELYEGTLAELLDQLGGIPAHRVLLKPAPGTATEEDVLKARSGPWKRICELIDGTLVEKDMSTNEGFLSGVILHFIWVYLDVNDLGLAFPGDAHLRLRPGLIRVPDVSFVPWNRIPNEELPDDPIASLAPELAVEVITPNNTKREIELKLADYFAVGCKLAWIIDPETKTAKVYNSAKRFKELDETGTLEGGKVLPGFKLALADIFAATKRRKKKPS
jgi:Uma2 family endonuclease